MNAIACPSRCDSVGAALPCVNPGKPNIELLSGATCCTWCEAWRAECAVRELEARSILRITEKVHRMAALDVHEAAHGKLSRDRLSVVILSIWERRRAAAQSTNQGAV